MSDPNVPRGAARYADRLAALQRVSDRLTVAGVPHTLYRHVRNGAPSPGDPATMPAIELAGGWRTVKALYFDGVLRFSYPYLASRSWPVDEAGIDRLASRVVVDYLDASARGHLDDRGM